MATSEESVWASVRATYEANGQGQVFRHWDKLDAPARARLIAQLQSFDTAHVNAVFADTMAAAATEAAAGAVAARIAPITDVVRTADMEPARAAALNARGLAAIASGQVAALVMAGGQGTRLGFDRPKGEYDIGLPSHKTLFQLQVERLLRVRQLAAEAAGKRVADVSLPLYVMTSPMTDADTRAYFAEHANFGLADADIVFFVQGTMPCLDASGKMILESAGVVAEAPDGNGGIYRALHLTGVLADMQRRGVLGVHVFAVDNAIVRVADPLFVGLCLESGADVGSKVCTKAGPHERVGVVCKKDGAYAVVEYSEMDKASAEMVGADGRLVFNAGNLCMHYYSVAFLTGSCALMTLPKIYHVARKAIPSAHPDTGVTRTAAESSASDGMAVKLESFIFDVFPAARHMAVLEVARELEFSPVKNAPGAKEDSPDTARALVLACHRAWASAAGLALPAEGAVEVSTLLSYGGEGLPASLPTPITAPALLAAAGEQLTPAAAAAGTHVYFA